MARQLRPRKGKNYALLEDSNAAGPSKTILSDADSGSDFSPDKDAEGIPDDEYLDEIMEQDAVTEDPVPEESVEPVTGKGKGRVKTKKTTNQVTSSSRRKSQALPTPSVHHRHRATALFSRHEQVERLTEQPQPFGPSRVTSTNSFTQSNQIADRVSRAWGFNVGPGPEWHMIEDRRWFKEAETAASRPEAEAKRRPRVYQHVPVKDGWKVFDRNQAASYLPTADETTEEGSFKPPPPVPCFFGPVKAQVRREVQMMEAFSMSEYFAGSQSYVFNAGAPVWALDWCPIHVNEREGRSFKRYLAVAPFPNSSHSPEIGIKVQRPSPSCIQIWSFAQQGTKCELVLCIDNGPALELKWCPLPTNDAVDILLQSLSSSLIRLQPSASKRTRKLGLLAGTFEDGSFCIYAVPDPDDMTKSDSPTLVHLTDPILRIEHAETACWSFDWANSERVAIGTTSGVIAVYDIAGPLASYKDPSTATITNIRPAYYLSIHQSAVRALAWIQAPPTSASGEACLTSHPTVIASGGYDGVECLTDIREGRGFIMNRTRDVINTLTFSPYAAGPITMDHENAVKSYAASPSMLGRGHTLLEPAGPVWSVNASEYHPQLAIAAADGTCSTVNILRSPRRGGSVPFFVHKIYQLDYSRTTKEFRMLEHFLPQEVPDARSAVTKAGKEKNSAPAPSGGTGAWSREVGIHRVCWNNGNGLGSSSLLASATASGLCRIDALWGRFMKNRIPYGEVENIRMENGAMDVDSDPSESEDLSS
ncbi:hypothetical protein FA15DRAFT_761163 [Coprinopsis marcescibilis]|uniref:WD40 repeat-like protein n=1 Tax=Coprinopsis marcescibilis TaxID=230819 RepID=A0A5C3KBG2_COPMA|nr:hypothetical protein FA15DRAFT_761163 [Coprinopsis marcescibilis]